MSDGKTKKMKLREMNTLQINEIDLALLEVDDLVVKAQEVGFMRGRRKGLEEAVDLLKKVGGVLYMEAREEAAEALRELLQDLKERAIDEVEGKDLDKIENEIFNEIRGRR